jgi:hypothetical protein
MTTKQAALRGFGLAAFLGTVAGVPLQGQLQFRNPSLFVYGGGYGAV